MIFGEFPHQRQSGFDAVGTVDAHCIHGHGEDNNVTSL